MAITSEEEQLIAYCGLYCGDCTFHQGKVADLARDLRKELRAAKFTKTAEGLSPMFKAFADYPACYEVLGAMVKLRCKRGCREMGGNPSCKIRNCCLKKETEGCWECEDFEDCDKLRFLETIHDEAHLKNLRRIRKHGTAAFVQGKRDW